MSILDALRRGWWSGLSEIPETVAGGTGLLERLIPGKQDFLTEFERKMNENAETVRSEAGDYEPKGILEKIAEGLGAAPGTVLSMAAPVAATAGLGPIAGPAAGFGLYGAIRHGDEGLPQALGQGLKGAAEGALFGVAGKVAGRLGATKAGDELLSKQLSASIGSETSKVEALQKLIDAELNTPGKKLLRKAAHGVGAGAITGGMTALHGGSAEDAWSSAGTMGILGVLSGGKYKSPTATQDANLASIRPEVVDYATKRALEVKELESRPKAEIPKQEPALEVKPTELPPGSPTIVSDFTESGSRAKPYEMLTEAGKQRYYDFKDHLNEVQQKGDYQPRTNDDIAMRAATAIRSDAEGNIYGGVKDFDAMGQVLFERVNAKANEVARLQQLKALAEKEGRPLEAQELGNRISSLNVLFQGDLLAARGFESATGSALRTVGLAKRNSPEWVQATKHLEKKGVFKKDGSGQFREDIEQMLQLSEGNPLLQAKIAKALDTPTLFDKMQEYWINGLLSGPPTHMVNTMSNALFGAIDVAEKSAATMYQAKRGMISRDQAKLEIASDLRATMNALPKALRVFADIALGKEDAQIRPELSQAEMFRQGQTKVDYRSKAISGKAGEFIRTPSKLLQAMDVAFKVIAGDRYGTTKALRMAYEDAKAGRIQQNRESIMAKADEYLGNSGKEVHKDVLAEMQKNAKRLTFTEEIGGFGQKVISARDVEIDVPGLGKVRPLVGVLPFVSTPYNVIRQSVARSPLGVLRLKGLNEQYKRGEITAQDFHREVAGWAMGSTVTAGLIGLAKAGFLTGGGPVNQQDRQNLLATGWRPYSLHIPGAGYMQMQRIEPLGTILGMAADIAEYGDAEDKTGKLMAIIKDNVTDKSFLYGLESLAKAWSNPEQFGATYYRQMAGSIVPTGVAKIQQAVDPYARDVKTTGAALGVPDPIAYRIPGLSQELPLRTTAFGEPQERWGSLGTENVYQKVAGGVQSVLFPSPMSLERKGVEVEKEFQRLAGFEGMPPSSPKKSKRMVLRGANGENVELTDSEYRVYDKHHQAAKARLEQIIASPNYQRMPDSAKAKLLKSVYDRHREIANKEINMMIRKRTTVGD